VLKQKNSASIPFLIEAPHRYRAPVDVKQTQENFMQILSSDYLNAYRSLKLTRDAEGVVVAQFHTNGGPLTFTAQDHTEFVDAFYRVGQDRSNKIVILTGAGGEFIPGIDIASFGNFADPGVLSLVHNEGVQIVENIVNIRVPVIAAVEGRACVHSEYALLAHVIVAGEGVTFNDHPTSLAVLFPATESSQRGAIARDPAGPKRSY
jgi:enoyl-CoA hydratase/carnithine racemase